MRRAYLPAGSMGWKAPKARDWPEKARAAGPGRRPGRRGGSRGAASGSGPGHAQTVCASVRLCVRECVCLFRV